MSDINELSFDEYSALRRRNRHTEKSLDTATSPARQDSEGKSQTAVTPPSPTGILGRLGNHVESQEVQILLLVVACFDACSAILELLLLANALGDVDSGGFIRQFLQYQVVFTYSVYLLEFVLLGVAFQLSLLGHAGYVVDMAVVGTVLYVKASGGHPAIRLLGISRFWRLGRVVNSILDGVRQEHEQTKELLQAAKKDIDYARYETKQARIQVKRETQKVKRIEQSFEAQREELDTLREALSIAAKTVAEVQGYPSTVPRLGSPVSKSLVEFKTDTPHDEAEDFNFDAFQDAYVFSGDTEASTMKSK